MLEFSIRSGLSVLRLSLEVDVTSPTSSSGSLKLATLMLLLTVGKLAAAQAYQYYELADFSLARLNGGVVGGGNPIGAVDGADNGPSTVWEFVLPPLGTLETLYTFGGPPDGAAPNTTLAIDRAGNIYGTTAAGGAYNAGTVYELFSSDHQWQERILYNFTGGSDGGSPLGAVFLDTAGHLYGVTSAGGRYNSGVVYRVNVAAAPLEAVLHSFGGPGDAMQTSPVIGDAAGNLYGTATGGAYPNGIVYQLTPHNATFGWKENVVYAFTGGADGGAPSGGVIFDASGNLYGATSSGGHVTSFCLSGCGVIFEVTPHSGGNWTESVLYAFQDTDNGVYPNGPVTFDSAGNLYVSTMLGGTHNTGTIDKLTPSMGGPWTETTLTSFPNVLFLQSNGGLDVDSVGNIFGTYNSDNHAGLYEVSP